MEENSRELRYKACLDAVHLSAYHCRIAGDLAEALSSELKVPTITAIDCVPNGSTNAFDFEDGQTAAKILAKLCSGYQQDNILTKLAAVSSSPAPEFDIAMGEKIGLFKRVELDNLYWRENFIVRSKLRGPCLIWHNHKGYRGLTKGLSTSSEIEKLFRKGKPVYWQKFYDPLADPTDCRPDNKQGTIYKLLFFCEPGQATEFIGGLWIARRSFKIYITSDAIVGPIMAYSASLGE